MKVALSITCYTDTLFPEAGRAVMALLERLAHTADFPAGQTCCGQMHYNTGYQAEALTLLPRFVQQFKHAAAVVDPTPSCVTMMREHYPDMAKRLGEQYPGIVAQVASLLPWACKFGERLKGKLGLTGTPLRKNVRHATGGIQAWRARVVGEMPDWQALQDAGSTISFT